MQTISFYCKVTYKNYIIYIFFCQPSEFLKLFYKKWKNFQILLAIWKNLVYTNLQKMEIAL